jgi:hypothetical protein
MLRPSTVQGFRLRSLYCYSKRRQKFNHPAVPKVEAGQPQGYSQAAPSNQLERSVDEMGSLACKGRAFHHVGVLVAVAALSFYMKRTPTRAPQPDKKSASLLEAWWESVLAGDIDEPHPIYRDVKVQLHGGRLRLSGELDSVEARAELVGQARERIGRGIDRVDVSDLVVAKHQEKPGILEQTLISAFPNRVAAEYARDFVLKHSRVIPKQDDVLDANDGDKVRRLIPEDFAPEARNALDAGRAILILRVDETEAFRVRELLEEDTRSEWTIAAPPELAAAVKK